jgi:hypothetical protein
VAPAPPKSYSAHHEWFRAAAGFSKQATAANTAIAAAKISLGTFVMISSLREWVNKTMPCHQQQNDFLLSTTLKRSDYRKIPSRFLEP